MAVEARRFSSPQQFMLERNSLNQEVLWPPYISQQIGFDGLECSDAPQGYWIAHQPLQYSIQAKPSVNSDCCQISGVSGQRKRSFDSLQGFRGGSDFYFSSLKPKTGFYFSGEEILPQIQQSQTEIDAVIAQHTKRLRLGFAEGQRQHFRFLCSTIGEGAMKKLREKDEQIQRLGKLNQILQERVKHMCAENQLLQDLAQRNEATANSLRSDLEQVLLHAGGEPAVPDDAESVCSSSNGNSPSEDRLCRRCGEKEACVLLLPCRHLCLCTLCGGGAHQLRLCPVCERGMSATLHVNPSP